MEKEKIGCPITLGEYERIKQEEDERYTKEKISGLKKQINIKVKEIKNLKNMIDELHKSILFKKQDNRFMNRLILSIHETIV